MKIRTQLVLASFLLSVLPLSGIVIYSYYSSRRALEVAYQHEATRVAQQMDHRLGNISHDLEQRLAALSALQTATPNGGPDVRNVLLTMGDAASLVDAVEIKPVAKTWSGGLQPAVGGLKAAAPHAEPMLIDLPPGPAMPHFQMSDEQRALIRQISQLGGKLGKAWNAMTPEERATTEQQLRTAQADLDSSLRSSRQQWENEYTAARAEARAEAHADARAEADDQSQKARDERRRERLEASAPPAVVERKISESERESIREAAKRVALLFGHGFDAPVSEQGNVVAQVSAQISAEEVIDRVLSAASDDRSEIAFAIDREGNVYTRSSAERQKLNELGVAQRIAAGRSLRSIRNWIVVESRDPNSGLRIGVARPVGEDYDELRKTAAKNFGYGIALVFVALIGIVPLANHMTGDVNLVTRGAERVARGDLMTRLPVRSNNEFGQLAMAFNRMAEDLSLHQQKIVQQEVQQRLLGADNERKGVELEDARRFQLSLLPKEVPQHPAFDIAVFTQTATEVGGDYYDFHLARDGALSVTVGDATGHGAKAGTMVTVIKTLFAGYVPEVTPSQFLRDAAEKVKRMDLGRMAMALLVARFDGLRLIVASAGMPPLYVHRASSGEVEELARGATPLGTLGADYADIATALDPGDALLLMSDGFPELQNATGQQLGYSKAMEEFQSAASATSSDGVIAALTEAARRWHGDQPPNDDVTFVVVKARRATA